MEKHPVPWGIIGFVLIVLVVVLFCCKGASICDGKITTLAPGQTCSQR